MPLRPLWIAVFLSPRKTHTIFLSATYNDARLTIEAIGRFTIEILVTFLNNRCDVLRELS